MKYDNYLVVFKKNCIISLKNFASILIRQFFLILYDNCEI
jgi:hypothetical protein